MEFPLILELLDYSFLVCKSSERAVVATTRPECNASIGDDDTWIIEYNIDERG